MKMAPIPPNLVLIFMRFRFDPLITKQALRAMGLIFFVASMGTHFNMLPLMRLE